MLRTREMFVPLSHRPDHAQADFGEADGYIGGKKVRFHYFCMDLPHSDGCFVKAYPAETAEAFCDGHVAAFDFFGGVPQSILYDNTKLAVAKIVKGGKRLRSKMFADRCRDWTQHPGTSPPMRITASWFGFQNPTEYKYVAR